MIDKEIYKYFASLVYQKTGIFYPEKDYYRLDSRLNTLKKLLECDSYEDLHKLYLTQPSKKHETILIDLSTNNETYFFRDNKPFDALAKDIVPLILSKNKFAKINIWSCACSTGQEPLSIVMSLKDLCPDLKHEQLKVDATDISQQALDKCKTGAYSQLEVKRGLPEHYLNKYFTHNNDSLWKANQEILSLIDYGHFNLLTDTFIANKYDIVFCRNVLIYQDKENRERIIQNLYTTLKPGGFLLMGAGESMIGSKVNFEQITFSNMMVFQKPALDHAKV